MTTLPLADITEVTLEGEPGSDKAFQVDGGGEVYRIRVKLVEEIPPAFVAEGGVAPILQAFDVTLTRLVGGEVLRDAAGRVIIAAHTRLTIDETTKAAPGFAIATEFDRAIRHLVYQAEARRVADDEAADYLANEWAVEPLVPA